MQLPVLLPHSARPLARTDARGPGGGYNCIDVYMPWNDHEVTRDSWDFGGERDVAAFLQMAAEEGLWVLARPGPYICSEWDGGGLPAYLLTDGALRLRDNDAGFLRHVARWFDQILPILSRFQLGAAGTVIAVQLENELDFYDCADPRGYIEVLRDAGPGPQHPGAARGVRRPGGYPPSDRRGTGHRTGLQLLPERPRPRLRGSRRAVLRPAPRAGPAH